MLALAEPRPDDIAQVVSYADTIQKKFPNFHVRKYMAYIVGNKGYKFWEVWGIRLLNPYTSQKRYPLFPTMYTTKVRTL